MRTIPEGGYTLTDVMDDDGHGTRDIPITVRIDVQGDHIRLDFTGTAPQVPGNINTDLNATQAAACYAIKALLDPEVPNNQGVLNVVEVFVPRGTLINCAFPAAVAQRATTCQRIIARKVRLEDKPMGVTVAPNQTVIIETPGAGGYSPPVARNPDKIREDVRSNKFTTAYIAEHYRDVL